MRSERVNLHRVLGVTWCAENAQTDYIMLHKVPQRLFLISHDLCWRRLSYRAIPCPTRRSALLWLNGTLLQICNHWLSPILRQTARIDHLIRIVFTGAERIIIIICIRFLSAAANGDFHLLGSYELLKILIGWPCKIYAAKKVKGLAECFALRGRQCHALVLALLCLSLRLRQVRLKCRISEDFLEAHRSCRSRHVFQLLLSHYHCLLGYLLG